MRHRFRLQVKAPRLPPAPLDIHASPLFHPICELALLFQPTLLAVVVPQNLISFAVNQSSSCNCQGALLLEIVTTRRSVPPAPDSTSPASQKYRLMPLRSISRINGVTFVQSTAAKCYSHRRWSHTKQLPAVHGPVNPVSFVGLLCDQVQKQSHTILFTSSTALLFGVVDHFFVLSGRTESSIL